MYKREAEKTIKKISETFRVLLVTGPRQVGKTTLLKENMPEGMNYVSLDDKFFRHQAKTDPKLFLEEHPYPLLIDEVQYAPELFPYIKMKVDEVGERGMYWLTGSQQFSLMKNAQESLAGRVGIVGLNSFSFAEIMGRPDEPVFDPENIIPRPTVAVDEIFDVIFRGGMPELYDIPTMDRNSFFRSYVETYLSRDIKEQLDIRDVPLFRKFMTSVATKNCEQLNYSTISSEIGVSDKTVRSWLGVLETSGIVYLLEPEMDSALKRMTHSPKIIFMDSGLCAYLAGWQSARALQLSPIAGHYLEAFVISEIIKSYNANMIETRISYYRDKDKNEIDLVFSKNDTKYPFEIKKTATPDSSMVKNFSVLSNSKNTIGKGGLVCFHTQKSFLTPDVDVIPVSFVIR